MSIAIIGTSVAGLKSAQALRAQGYDGTISIFGSETGPLYDKPALSKEYLRGEVQVEGNLLIPDEEIRTLDLDLYQGYEAVGVDTDTQIVSFHNGETYSYGKLIIATGARSRASFWEQRKGMHELRTLEDADDLRKDIASGDDVVIIGAGFIGSEVAASLAIGGARPFLVDPLALPMQRGLDDHAGTWYRNRHDAEGVQLRLSAGVDAVRGVDHDFEVVLSNGEILATSTVVLGLGAQPNDEWLNSSKMTIDDGVMTDEYCRAIGVQNVYAIGDVARVYTPKLRSAVRREHWTNAVDQASFIARDITGSSVDGTHFTSVPYVWSDQFDWKMQIVGDVRGEHRWVIGSPLENNRGAVVYSDGEGLFGRSIIINWPRALIMSRKAAAAEAPAEELVSTLEGLL